MSAPPRPPKRREFSYAKGYFLWRLVLWLTAAIAALAFLGVIIARTPGEWLAAFAILFTLMILVWGFSPLLTDHWLTTSRLILRQGWYFRGTFPLRGIVEAEPFEGSVPLGLRAPIGRKRLYVTGSKVGLVLVRLREPRRFLSVMMAEVDEIVFDVDARVVFLDAIRERLTSLAPVQPERADPYLRD